MKREEGCDIATFFDFKSFFCLFFFRVVVTTSALFPASVSYLDAIKFTATPVCVMLAHFNVAFD